MIRRKMRVEEKERKRERETERETERERERERERESITRRRMQTLTKSGKREESRRTDA